MGVSQLVNEHEAAERLALSVKTLRRWRVVGGPIPFCKIGGAVRYDVADLDRLIESSKRRNTYRGGEEANNEA